MNQLSTSIDLNSITEDAEDNHLAIVAHKLKACGDELRMQILQCLRADAFGVLELTQIFDTKQSGMSHHLKVLSKAGLVEAQREGNSIFYRRPIQSQRGIEFLANHQLFVLVDALPLNEHIEQRVQEVRSQRAAQSLAFFTRNTDRFAEQQELICDHDQYAPTSLELLKSVCSESTLKILEIGPGEGQFLGMLSRHFDHIDAIDTSTSMLNIARDFCSDEGIENISLYEGEARNLVDQGRAYDGIILNMVLHHVPAPATLFKDSAQLLDSGGVLVICDLSHHNQEWTKQNCGDIWLGFETEELNSWAEASGFQEDEAVFIGLRNGFQIQVHRFIKA